MPRYNLRMLRGERVAKKKEGNRITQWESDYEHFINDVRNVLSVEKIMEEIAQTFENNAIEQEKVSLICPLTKEHIVVPVRYHTCRHLQCFDLKGFLAMKAKRNFLVCPICNTKVDSELTGLRIDKFFQNILSDVSGATEAEVLRDGAFRAVHSLSALIVPKVIDNEEPLAEVMGEIAQTFENNAIKQEKVSLICPTDIIEEMGSVSSFYFDSEANASNAKIKNCTFRTLL